MKNFLRKFADFQERHGKLFFLSFAAVFAAVGAAGITANLRGGGIWDADRYFQLVGPIAFLVGSVLVFRMLWRGFRPIESVLLPGEGVTDISPRQMIRYNVPLNYRLQFGRIILTDRRVMFVASPFSSPTYPFAEMWLPGRGEGTAAVWVKSEGLRVFFDYGMTHFSFEVADEAALAKWKSAFRVA